MISIIIPSRNEIYLNNTIDDIVSKATEEIEIIVVLEGYWHKPIVTEDNIHYIHNGKPEGMRAAINAAVALSNGDYILKVDAHCMFEEGFDTVLMADIKDNWVVVPRRYALDPEKWEVDKTNHKYPVDYMFLTRDFTSNAWQEKNKDPKLKDILIDDIPSSQGSCWFMKKSYFYELELLDDTNYGTFYKEFQEIALKCWLSGGRVVVNKKTWYAHWHKPSSMGRGYHLDQGERDKANKYLETWKAGKGWHKQKLPFDWIFTKFGEMK